MTSFKSIRARIDPWDRQKMVKFLEKQARNGWLFFGFGEKGWTFKAIEPNTVHFSVVYFPADFEKDENAVSRLQEFREFCAHAGWELAGSDMELQVFCSTRDNPVPIDTDPLLEVKTMQTMALRKLKPQFKENARLGVFYLTLGLLAFHVSPIRALTYILCLLWLTSTFGELLVALIRLGEQLLWYRQAKRYAQRYGEFPHNLRRLRISTIVDVLVGIIILETIIRQLGVSRTLGLAVISALVIGAGFWLGHWINDQILGRKTQFILSAAAVVAVILAGMSLYLGALRAMNMDFFRYAPLGSAWAQYEEVPPLSAEEFYGEGTVESSYYSQVKESVFLAEYLAWNHSQKGKEYLDLDYTVLEVKWDALYDVCKNEYLDSEHFQVDAAPWGAQQAYRYGTPEEPKTLWLLCYEDRIVQFCPEEEPTPEQMALVARVLGNEQNFEN